MWKATGAIAAFAAVLLAPAAAQAEQEAYSAALNYATPAVVGPQGGTLRFTNLDTLAPHDLVPEEGLFRTNLLQGNGPPPAQGREKLPTRTYSLPCTIQPWMTGQLQAVPRALRLPLDHPLLDDGRAAGGPRDRRRRPQPAGAPAAFPGHHRARPGGPRADGRGRAARCRGVAALRPRPVEHPRRRQRGPRARGRRPARTRVELLLPSGRLHRYAGRRRRRARGRDLDRLGARAQRGDGPAEVGRRCRGSRQRQRRDRRGQGLRAHRRAVGAAPRGLRPADRREAVGRRA